LECAFVLGREFQPGYMNMSGSPVMPVPMFHPPKLPEFQLETMIHDRLLSIHSRGSCWVAWG